MLHHELQSTHFYLQHFDCLSKGPNFKNFCMPKYYCSRNWSFSILMWSIRIPRKWSQNFDNFCVPFSCCQINLVTEFILNSQIGVNWDINSMSISNTTRHIFPYWYLLISVWFVFVQSSWFLLEILPSRTNFCSQKNGSSNILLENWLIFWQISRVAKFRFQKNFFGKML